MRFTLAFFVLLFSLRHIGIHLLPILNGFITMHICLVIFVSRRAMDEVRNSELRVRLFRIPAIKVDLAQKRVRVSLWGHTVQERLSTSQRVHLVQATASTGLRINCTASSYLAAY